MKEREKVEILKLTFIGTPAVVHKRIFEYVHSSLHKASPDEPSVIYVRGTYKLLSSLAHVGTSNKLCKLFISNNIETVCQLIAIHHVKLDHTSMALKHLQYLKLPEIDAALSLNKLIGT